MQAPGCQGSCCQPSANHVSIVELAPRHDISVLQVSKEKQKKARMAPLASPALPFIPAPGSEVHCKQELGLGGSAAPAGSGLSCRPQAGNDTRERKGPRERVPKLQLPGEPGGARSRGSGGSISAAATVPLLRMVLEPARPCQRSPASVCSAGDAAGEAPGPLLRAVCCVLREDGVPRWRRVLTENREEAAMLQCSGRRNLTPVKLVRNPAWNVLGVTPSSLGRVGKDTCRFSGGARLPSAARSCPASVYIAAPVVLRRAGAARSSLYSGGRLAVNLQSFLPKNKE